MPKDSIAIILDALHRLEAKTDQITVDLNANTLETRDLKNAYASLAPLVESVKQQNDRLSVVETKHESLVSNIGTGLKIGGGVFVFVFSGFWFANTLFIDKEASTTANTVTHQILDQQAILNDNKVTLSTDKTKKK